MKSSVSRPILPYAAAPFLVLILGCASQENVFLEIPFQYRALGAANEGVRFPVISRGKEKHAFSTALVRVLQELEYSLIAPRVSIGEPLPESQRLQTDAVPLAPSTIDAHNSSSTIGSIPSNAHYRLSYELEYRVNSQSVLKHRHFSLIVWAKLERRGAGGQWHVYPKPYSGVFFASRLHSLIESELTKAGSAL